MKKIVMITKIKNEADIIECFLRYHCNIFDLILVIDNGSLDGTSEIVNALIKEGLPIRYIDTSAFEFDAFKFANKYTYDFVNQYDADYVTFMDADEFIFDVEGGNVRNGIERLDEESIHYVNWRTYLYNNKTDGMFDFKDYNSYRDDAEEKFTKVIIPGKLVLEKKVIIAEGNHSAKVIGGNKTNYIHNIKFLHFPIRGKNQYTKQIILNSINMMSYPDKGIQTGSHWKKMYDILNNEINLEKMSMEYSYYEGKNTIHKAIDCHIETKYDLLINNDLQSLILQFSELLALKLRAERMKESIVGNKRSKILVYGTGGFCNRMVQRINNNLYEVVAFIDTDKEKQFTTFNNKIVISPEKIKFFDFDIIAIGSELYADEMKSTLRKMLPWLPAEKIIDLELLIIEGYK